MLKKIVSGGQTGADRAALDVAIERGLDWGGWCPKGGWAEDFLVPPGLLEKYPHLTETPSPHPRQRTEWNVRDSDAALIITDSHGLLASIGPQRADRWAHRHGTPELVVDVDAAKTSVDAAKWLLEQRKRFGPYMNLNIGGPRESESQGIYAKARLLIASILDQMMPPQR